jgi:mono/diheme cytochrome c family protein
MRKVLLVVVAVLMAVPLVLVGALFALTPRTQPASAETVERTPARLVRGEYLAKHVSGCVDCHTSHDYSRRGAPESGPLGAGGFCLREADGFPGHLCTANITSDRAAGVGAWTDGELLRAIRDGVDREGRPLFPMMPYEKFSHLGDEDLRSIVAYVRTLPPSARVTPPKHLAFPLSLLIRLAPGPVTTQVTAPSPSDTVAYGEYLTTVAACEDCHTPTEKGKPLPGMRFAGGQQMKGPWGTVTTANITPDDATGIGRMTRDQFIARFQAMAALPTDQPAPATGQTVMPWSDYGGMTASDLGSIYDYLRTVPKVHHAVQAFAEAHAQR